MSQPTAESQGREGGRSHTGPSSHTEVSRQGNLGRLVMERKELYKERAPDIQWSLLGLAE